MAERVPNKAKNTSRSGAWATGTGIAAPGNDQDAGGANLAKPLPVVGGGSALNAGRSRISSAKEVHYNGGTASIKTGSTRPAR